MASTTEQQMMNKTETDEHPMKFWDSGDGDSRLIRGRQKKENERKKCFSTTITVLKFTLRGVCFALLINLIMWDGANAGDIADRSFQAQSRNDETDLPGTFKGEKGEVGPPGVVGSNGIPGIAGVKGDKGDQGMPGTQGSVGNQGSKGNDGNIGRTGKHGPKGTAGTPGNVGVKGQKGEIGYEGPQGFVGNPGISGRRGLNGNPGRNGQKGQIGTAGLRGSNGNVGPQGPAGVPGVKGNTGHGLLGPKGSKGINGARGIAGYKGVKGSLGTRVKGQKGEKGTIEDTDLRAQLTILRLEIREHARGLRLRGGNGINSGRVEIYIEHSWGTICDDGWDINNGNVVCRILGFTRATSAPASAHFGEGTGKIWLDDVDCKGSENRVTSCSTSSLGVHNCGHSEDASVICI